MEYFDTHSHITLCQKNISIEEHIQRAMKNEVVKILDPGLHPKDYEERHALLKHYNNVYMGVALAPHHIDENSIKDVLLVEKIIKKYSPVAISEIGLDYRCNLEYKQEQKKCLEYQLELSKKYKLPVFLHIRDAYVDSGEIVKHTGAYKGVVHCFSGNINDAKLFLDLGFYLSFPGIVTFKNAKEVQEAMLYTPLDRMVVETDSPYLAPVPVRGRPNESAYVKYIVDFIVEKRPEEKEIIIETIYNNSLKILNID